jgi:hypothetical protein
MAWIDVHVLLRQPLTETMNPKTLSVKASASVVYYCESDAVTTLDAALTASTVSTGGMVIPALNSSYSTGRPYCRCVKREAEWISPTIKHVTCDFEDPTDGSSSAGLLSQPAKIGEGNESCQKAYQVDAEGNAVVNAAGAPFTNPPERQEGSKVYTIEKFVNATTKAAIDAAYLTNNEASVTIKGTTWAADELWMTDCSYQDVDGSTLQKATYVIKTKKGGWSDTGLNTGFRDANGLEIMIGPDGEPVDRAGEPDATGELPSEPWPLDESGIAKPAGEVADALTFWPYVRASWSAVPVS